MLPLSIVQTYYGGSNRCSYSRAGRMPGIFSLLNPARCAGAPSAALEIKNKKAPAASAQNQSADSQGRACVSGDS